MDLRYSRNNIQNNMYSKNTKYKRKFLNSHGTVTSFDPVIKLATVRSPITPSGRSTKWIKCEEIQQMDSIRNYENKIGEHERIQHNEGKGRKTILTFIQMLAKNSIVTGIPQIVEVPSNCRKAFKTLVLIFCLTGFIYQTQQYIRLYYSYSTSVQISAKYNSEMPLPKITVCNLNGFQRKPFCNDHPDHCFTPSNITEFCSSYPDYCSRFEKDENISVVITDLYSLEPKLLRSYTQESRKFIYDCCHLFKPVKNEVLAEAEVLYHSRDTGGARFCYSIDYSKMRSSQSEIGSESFDEALQCYIWSGISEEPSLTVVMNLESKQYSRPDIDPGVQVAITSSHQTVNPFLRGFEAKRGMKYLVRLQVTETILLPAPYKTNCTVDEKLDQDYIREICVQKCEAAIALEKCKCTDDALFAPEGKLCKTMTQSKCIIYLNFTDCYSICPQRCRTISFEYKIEEKKFQNTYKPLGNVSTESEEVLTKLLNASSFTDAEDKTIVTVIYDKRLIITYTYIPVYDSVEFVSSIGGYIGIWLGISLIAILDLLESLFVFICYLIRRRNENNTF